jgi:DNA-binding MarR family transcriptional regulator
MTSQDALFTLAKDKEITGECYRVLMVLLGQLDFENYIYVPQREIAEMLEMRPQHVNRAIKRLMQKGVLLHSTRGYRLNHNYGWKGKVRQLKLVKSP